MASEECRSVWVDSEEDMETVSPTPTLLTSRDTSPEGRAPQHNKVELPQKPQGHVQWSTYDKVIRENEELKKRVSLLETKLEDMMRLMQTQSQLVHVSPSEDRARGCPSNNPPAIKRKKLETRSSSDDDNLKGLRAQKRGNFLPYSPLPRRVVKVPLLNQGSYQTPL